VDEEYQRQSDLNDDERSADELMSTSDTRRASLNSAVQVAFGPIQCRNRADCQADQRGEAKGENKCRPIELDGKCAR
jgi:hypothetical protein